ncbi:hypothetical protein GCM10018772_71100 [Streptomyces fumanus]|uniref:Uncharacterized protein n=1 Tax=Streptomyces fumanus TaxID=67302 RepID=A0A919B0P2_9ACTN|nr:hypothetical protein GCM10018772_71100 [Streptomyces fumanus]
MEIHLQNSRHERVSEKVADADGSFLALCREAPKNSVLQGVQEIGDTMFNEMQCRQIEAYLTGLSEGSQTQVLREVAKLAQQAVSCHGYLYVVGD